MDRQRRVKKENEILDTEWCENILLHLIIIIIIILIIIIIIIIID